MKLKTPVSTPMVTVRAENREELVSAAGKKAEQLGTDTESQHVLVVYSEGSAQIFCEPPAEAKKKKKEPVDAQGPQTPVRVITPKGN